LNTKIIVVDNKSNDRTVHTIQTHFPKVHVLKQKINSGFGQGNNIGLQKARGAYILLLNPDTIINAYAITTMMRFLRSHPRTGAVGPEQFNSAGNMIFMASRLSFLGIIEYAYEKIYRFILGRTTILFPWPHKTYMLNAGCLLLRADLLPTRQWFDPDYFMYGEENHLFKQIHTLKWDAYFLPVIV
jgi:GT2 family glycosyltransferase